MMELKKASDSVKSWDTTSISLAAGCDLFMHYVTRTSALEYEDFNLAKSRFLERSEKCGEISYKGRPDRTGLRLSNELAKLDVLVKLLIDSAVAYNMDEVDMIFVGRMEWWKAEFARLYPLDQKDMVPALRPIDFGVPIPLKVEVETSAQEYTPPQYLTLLFTDLGVLTLSVLSPTYRRHSYRTVRGPLMEVLGIEVDTSPRIIVAIWHYKISHHLSPSQPIHLDHKIKLSGSSPAGTACYDILVDVPFPIQKEFNALLADTEKTIEIDACDEDICTAIRKIHEHRRR
ncbi:unnamed protein product [Ilex paraguariensis]|uniref:Translation initiation factor eIF2B subunit alpha n=1 Tax=Ilex paraguariensis TaxID=185542 RepID=A0ABC8U693_9AQUA